MYGCFFHSFYATDLTEALCHLSVTDIKKHFATFDFFCKNEASVNCGTLNATTLIWLLVLGYKKKMKETLKADNSNA